MPEEQVVPTEEVAQETPEVTEQVTEEKAEEVVETQEETPPPPKKKSAQERIDELTRKRREAEREAEYWRRAALEKEKEEKPATPVAPQIPPKPTLDQFESTEQFVEALIDWREKEREIKTASTRQQEEQEKALRTFNERAKKIREEHDDFDEVAEKPIFSPAMRDALALDENGPEIVYYLGTNEEEAARIRNLPVVQQMVELGVLKTKLLLAKKTKKVTSAPTPPTPVGMAGGTKEKELSEMTTDEAMRYFDEQRLAKIKARLGVK